MNKPTTARQRYAAAFVILILASSLYVAMRSLRNGPSQLDSSVPGRKPLMDIFTRLRLKVGDRVFTQALVGKQGWLEYTNDRNLDSLQNCPTLPPGGIQNIENNLTLLYDKLRERNITLLVVIPPNKATIYPDKLPDQIQKCRPQSELDMLVNDMKQHGPPVLVDLRPALLEARKQRDVYYKTDTHWNSYGAFVGYTEIMKSLSQTYPQLAPRKISSFHLESVPPYVHDIARLMGSTSILEADSTLTPKNQDSVVWITYNSDPLPMTVSYTHQDELPRLLMYRDSFGIGLTPLMAPQFSQATFIQTLSSYSNIRSMHELDVAKPDIVIVEFVERDLWYLNRWLESYTEGLQ